MEADDPIRFEANYRAANVTEGPLFRPANRKTKSFTKNAMTGIDIRRMKKRRLKAACLRSSRLTRSVWRR